MDATAGALLAQVEIEFAIRADGFLRLAIGPREDLLRGPVGVLGYLLFVPGFWWVPRRLSAAYLTFTSLLWAFLTVGPAYVLWLVAMVGGGWLTLRLANIGPFSLAVSRRGPRTAAGLILATAFGALLLRPQPFPLPPVSEPEPLYFYLHWAGLAYIFLKLYHLVVDTTGGRLAAPGANDYLAYILFAPTLRMGPIYRAGEFFNQLRNRPDRFRSVRPAAAFGRIALGLVRWGAVMGLIARFPGEAVFGRPESLGTTALLAGIAAQPLSIFLWISGYADVAVGLGRLMGFAVPENFNHPWAAKSLAEFWRRWHITLGLWLRDYIYIPLGGNRRYVFRNYCLTFGFCGLWHGLYPSYLAWGLSQGIGLYVNRIWRGFWERRRVAGDLCYRAARRARLTDAFLGRAIAWTVTLAYQVITIALFMDERHCGRRFLPELGRRLWETLVEY